MTPIARVSPHDVPKLLPIVQSFFVEGQFPGKWSDEHWVTTWQQFISHGLGAIFAGPIDKPTGLLGALCMPSHVNGDLCAQELFWYVLPEARGGRLAFQLFDAFERWAAEMKAVTITVGNMASLNHDQMNRFYTRRGYEVLETHYIKVR